MKSGDGRSCGAGRPGMTFWCRVGAWEVQGSDLGCDREGFANRYKRNGGGLTFTHCRAGVLQDLCRTAEDADQLVLPVCLTRKCACLPGELCTPASFWQVPRSEK